MKNKRIVVFVEFDSISKIIIKALESKEYEVIKLNNLDQAKAVFNGLSYALLITDADNRNNVSYKLINKIRGISSYLFLPVILMITGDKEMLHEGFADHNIACFLTKPFDMGHFYSVVERLT